MNNRRYYAIDHLRTGMMFVVMFGHPLLPYLTVPRSFKDDSTHIAFDVAGVFVYAFAMQAFFITAGFAAALLLVKKGSQGLWLNRFKRIFIPLLVGYIIITPLMRGAYDFAKTVVKTDSLDAGWTVFLAGEWIRWSKLYHLWFLVSLILFTALAMLLLTLISRLNLIATCKNWLAKHLQGYMGLALLALIVSISTVPSYVLDTGSGTHWSMQITLFIYFSLGWFLYGQQHIIDSWKTRWKAPLFISIILLPLCTWAARARLFDENNIDVLIGSIAGLSNGILGMCMSIALVGLFYAKLDRYSKVGETLGQASYWVYLIHFPIVVAAGGLVSLIDAPALIKYSATLAISIPLIALSYYTLVLHTPLQKILIGKTRSSKDE